ncbi:phospholipase D-like domain-containing protein [uncultured Chryseobacterium sp.]|uniref:phospholipase D-like domain-containing protein n=1 Tax=uncultured Chryseobacterium sp. TaxID=259322 RepID=UPI0025FDB218|nr:phospholipase D-like domain-containing protein [uncultured Chryseobacterium sp.]
MEKLILKEKIGELIGAKKVIAAIFYTFNFDPKFFENYIMPLLISSTGKNFNDEEIHNKILWRQLAKENQIPPISVYCDYYAKDQTNAPSLGYDINCLKVPSPKGKIANFHPKQTMILLEDNGVQKLLFITGSGNMTASGWCDNFECFSYKEISRSKLQPNRSSTNSVQDYINSTNKLGHIPKLLESENLINNFLRYVDIDFQFFNNYSNKFEDFLQKNIFEKETIEEVEIVSPYFSPDNSLLEWLKSKNIKKIKCLIPSLRNNEVQLEKKHFVDLEKAGLDWCHWNDSSLNTEVRNQHSKIYKFYSAENSYTIVGSVNFTNPAWAIFSDKNNSSNIESAVLYCEKNNGIKLLKRPNSLNIDELIFISGKVDLENPISANSFNRNAPDIDFTIDWKNRELCIKANIKNQNCNFFELFKGQQIKNGKSKVSIDTLDCKKLAKNSLIQVVSIENSKSVVYSYYANQDYINTKPLGFNLDAYTILRYWQFFDDEFSKESITRSIAEKITDESGVIDISKVETKLLLNEMATHFNGLIRMEKYLFPSKNLNQTEQREQFKNIQYYLLTENIDTLSFYLNDIANQFKEDKIQKSFYWMILKIVDQMMYAKAQKCSAKRFVDEKIWKQFIKDIKSKRNQFTRITEDLVNNIPDLKQKEKWIVEQIVAEYE